MVLCSPGWPLPPECSFYKCITTVPSYKELTKLEGWRHSAKCTISTHKALVQALAPKVNELITTKYEDDKGTKILKYK